MASWARLLQVQLNLSSWEWKRVSWCFLKNKCCCDLEYNLEYWCIICGALSSGYRLNHWVRVKNLPFSIEDLKKVTNSCQICAELKPRFHRFEGKLIKATSPFKRLNPDFKDPLPTRTRNQYLLTVVNKFSRFPFAVSWTDVSTATVIKHLKHLFSIFGIPAFIHSDRGASFMSHELRAFLTSQGVATSRTTPYNPRGNGQVERYNGIIYNGKLSCWLSN